MDRETAKKEIRERISCTDYLEPSKGTSMYCCPYCGSGKGTHGTGALKVYDTNTFTCHACHKSGDVIDLYMLRTGVDFNDAIRYLAESINLNIDRYEPAPVKNDKGGSGSAADYNGYYAHCVEHLKDPAAISYLTARGISYETAAAYWIGFDPEADPAGSGHKTPRIIMPTCAGHYVARSIDPNTPKAFVKMNNKGGSPAIFNAAALTASDVQEVFVTEGIFDALSILEAGAPALALNSAANRKILLQTIQETGSQATLILCLDNDKAGKEAEADLRQDLAHTGVNFISADICGGYKDPNEHLQHDRSGFIEAIKKAQQMTAKKPDNVAYYIETLMQEDVARFSKVKLTGFADLDRQSGGLNSGLYCIAAISSLGKTTFASQMADNLAAAGHDVLYFTLEQSRLEMVSKSIARFMAQKDPKTADSSLTIRRGIHTDIAKRAIADYAATVGDRISYIEGNFSCSISFIGQYIRQYIRRNNSKPVVFIDYLQILQPEQTGNRTQTVRETVDSTITELKRISRELDLTVIVISSVNRSNYLTPIDFESLKESGGIEYTCDVVWGLQLQCLNDPIFDKANNIKERREKIKAAKAASPRKIELVCLKNRYGISSYSCYFDYLPANDVFFPCPEKELDFVPEIIPRKAGRTL